MRVQRYEKIVNSEWRMVKNLLLPAYFSIFNVQCSIKIRNFAPKIGRYEI